ncbi:MAG: toll/interleukin-1 receptor domain-containing protein [Allosphingosinicella sp.]
MAESGPGTAGGYVAFISYSHRDAAMGRWLHRKLEGYRLPKRLVGTQGEDGEVPARLTPIFRDRDELPAAGDLSERVRAALAVSRNLIVLCSPNSAASPWVAKEIATFREIHPDRLIFTAIVEGEPGQCFSPALLEGGAEPLAADLRKEGDGRRLGLLKLVAGLAGVGLDSLIQRDAARRIRRILGVTVSALIAMLALAALTVVAFNARADAERQRSEADSLIDFMLTDLRGKLRGVGRLDVMDTVNERALRYYRQQGPRNARPADSAMLARVKLAIGEVELDRGNEATALSEFKEARNITASLIRRFPQDQNVVFAHAQSQYWIGYIDYLKMDFTGTKQAWLSYKSLSDQLLKIDASNPFWVREAGYAEGNLCALAMMPPTNEQEALRACRSALQRMEEVRHLQGIDEGLEVDLANRHAWMAMAWNANQRLDRATLHQAQHEKLSKALIASDPGNLDYHDIWMRGQFGFGEMLAASGRKQEARTRFAIAAASAAMLIRRDPSNATWRSWKRRIAKRMN